MPPHFSAFIHCIPKRCRGSPAAVDAVVTAFITGSFYFYLQSRDRHSKLYASLAVIFMILGFTSKEMTITLPAVFVWFDLVFPRSIMLQKYDLASLPKRLKLALVGTYPYWILIVVYFAVRLLALGTFVGGYDDNLLFISYPQAFIRTWINGLRLFTERSTTNWSVLEPWSANSGIFIWRLSRSEHFCSSVSIKTLCASSIFLTGWLVLCLAPVYKVFAISDDLQGSRFAYVATVPLCMLLTLFYDQHRQWCEAQNPEQSSSDIAQ